MVIWDGVDLPEVRSGSRVRVTNLRHKNGRQGEAELHGDSATVIQRLADGGESRERISRRGRCPISSRWRRWPSTS